MKKFLTVILFSCIVFGLVGCRGSNSNNINSDTEIKENSSGSETTMEDTQKIEVTWKRFHDGTSNVYMDYPEHMEMGGSGGNIRFVEYVEGIDNQFCDMSYAIFFDATDYCDYDDERGWTIFDSYSPYSDSLDSIIDLLRPLTSETTVLRYNRPFDREKDFPLQKLEVLEKELVTIGDMKALKFKGRTYMHDIEGGTEIIEGALGEFSVYGYIFIGDGAPCMLYDVVSVNEPKYQAEVVNGWLDYMMTTIKYTHRE